jgi:long-subunit acyl-CoA synthetase (AMP-forming)
VADKLHSVGRVDDVLVLANGEKVVPGSTEGTIVSHEAVRGAVMFGRGRNQVGVLVETDTVHAFDPANEVALAAFRNLIWYTTLLSTSMSMLIWRTTGQR